MYRHEYEESRNIGSGYPFYAVLMAAMRRADDINGRKLREAFPDVWDELQDRYNAPGGILDSD